MLVMDPEASSTSILPWNWVLGALSCSKKVDTSLLIDILKRAPEITDELEKNVREMVTLRILEDLSNEENQIVNNNASALGEKEELSSSGTEDVVQQILAEMSAENPKIDGQELQNRDVQSFIVQKRTSLPMCALQKIKEAILEGGSSVFESLRERSGLSVRTLCHRNTNCLGQELGECSREILANGLEESQSDLPDQNLAPASTSPATIPGENLVKQGSNDGNENDDGSNKNLKLVSNITSGRVVQYSNGSPFYSMSTNSSEGMVQYNGTGIVKATPLTYIKCSQFPHDSEMRKAEQQQRPPSPDADDHLPSLPEVEVYNNQLAGLPALLNGKKDGVVGGNGHLGKFEPTKSVVMEKDIFFKHPSNFNGFAGNFPINVSKGDESDDDISSNSELEITCDGKAHDDGRTYGSLKNDPLLFLHGNYSQESFATQPSSCIKCNGDGEFLVCNSNSCQLVVHPSCLRSAPTFDENGKFLCPFCAYARSISEFLEINKKKALARKNLAMFIGVQTDCQPKKSMRTSNGAEHGQSKGISEFDIEDDGIVGEDLRNKSLKSHPLSHRENGNQAGPRKSSLGDNPLARLKRFSPGSAKRKTHAESSEEDKEKNATSRHSKKRAKNSVKHPTDSAIPHLRRKALPWSKEEEKKLKEGLQKLASNNDATIPWSSILKYGAGTFQSGRTPTDLRDKWRNMCKASPSKNPTSRSV